MASRTALSSLRTGGDNVLKGSMACLIVGCLAAGCDRTKQAIATFGAGAGDVAAPAASLAPVVNDAHETRVIDTSTLEHREASPGNTFVVLDVTVRNPDTHPQVFSEGRLVAVDAGRQHSFPAPVTLLAGEFLSLQVLQPASTVRGKIAYEVPAGLQGVLYWQPGAGGKRILLHPGTAPEIARTLGNALDDDAANAKPVRTPPGVTKAAAGGALAASGHSMAAPEQGTAAAVAVTKPEPPRAADTKSGPAPRIASSTPAVATVAEPTPRDVSKTNEQARSLACQALLARNDPAEKSRYLGFFAHECGGYPMPSNWRPTVASAPSRVPPPPAPQSGPAFDCSQAWTHAEHLVCADAVLSLMDRQLNRAYADARVRVADPVLLQRDEDDWRHRVRDACDSIPCIERAYDRRTAELEAIGRNAAVR